jgi:hypothetical protein
MAGRLRETTHVGTATTFVYRPIDDWAWKGRFGRHRFLKRATAKPTTGCWDPGRADVKWNPD